MAFTRIFDYNIWSKGRISYYFAIGTMMVVPVYVKLLTPLMILWCVSWAIENRLRMSNLIHAESSYKLLLYLFFAYYLWQFFGVFYSENSAIGWNNVIKRISIVIFPIILISPGEMIKQNIKFLLRVFCISTFFFVIFCFGYATYNSIEFHNRILTFNPHMPIHKWMNYYYGINLAIYQHPSYLSMYILFSAFIAFDSFFDRVVNKLRKLIWLIIGSILLISIYFLSARAAILASIFLLPVYFLFKTLSKKRYLFAIIFVIIEVFVLFPVVLNNNRVSIFTRNVSEKSFSGVVRVDNRVIIWKSALRIVKRNILFGVGTGDVNNELLKEYQKIGNKELIEKRFNVHNQFIEVLLENGTIGFIIFFSIFGTIFYIAISKRNLMYLMYILIISIFFFFESMLYRIAGIAFFALFSFLLIHLDTKAVNQTYSKTKTG